MSDDNIEVVQVDGDLRAVIEYDPDPHDSNPRREVENLGVMWAPHRRYILGDGRYGSSNASNNARHRAHHPEWNEVNDWVDEVGERVGIGTPGIVKHLVRAHGATVVMPLFLYDHSGLSISAGPNLVGADVEPDRRTHNAFDPGGWDTSYVGFIFDTARTRERLGVDLERVAEALAAEVETYDQYLQGDVWGVRVEERSAFEGHAFRTARFTGNVTCERCGLVPVDEADRDTPCLDDDGEWVEVEDTACWGYLGREWAEQSAREALADVKGSKK